MTTVRLHTSMGDVTIELFDAKMPITTENFRKLVEKKFYDGTIFHRFISGFMIQGGDPEVTRYGGPWYLSKEQVPTANRHARGTITMANYGPYPRGIQFC